jgi:ELWxxDGT repeat protein
MYTSQGTANKFTGGPESGTLRGDDFARQAIGFRNVHVYADPYTKHIARLQDSEHDDALVATSEYGELSGDDYSVRVVSFYEVQAHASNGGNDQAVFYDTDGIDHLEADSSLARITRVGLPRDFSVEATAFEHVQMVSSNDDDIKDVSPGSVEWISSSPTQSAEPDDSVGGEAADRALTQLGQESDDRPNVLFISVDDLNDWVGALDGYAAVQTPNLDRLAARGVTFSKAYTPSPLCNPSRSAVLTGYYPTTSGVYKNTEDWRVAVPEAVSLPELFKENGYETVGGGKILHWNDRAIWDEYHPRIPNPDPTADVRQDESSSTDFFSWADLDVPDEEMCDAVITSWAADYLHEQHDSPFFLACGVFRPHIPLEVPQQYYDLYPLDEIELPEAPADDLDDIPDAGRALTQTSDINAHLLEDDNREELIQGYLASVSFADAQIGKVLDALESSEYADDTIVALWSDHGMHFGEKTHWKKGTLWEEATRVPLIVAGPGVAEPGSVSEHPVDLVSLYPTLADLCELPVDDSLDGVSLRPLLEDPDAEWDHPALMNFRDANAVRYEHWRYIRYGDGSEELYDHRTDPNEWTNLANDPNYEQVKAELAAMLPEDMALETPKRLNNPLHWDTIEPDSIPEPIVSGEHLLFSDYDTSTGRELWVTDGSAAPTLLADINLGAGSSNPGELVDWNGVTYFCADDGVHGSELWRTDGTSLGTWMVSDIRAGLESSAIDELVVADDKLYFRADDGDHGVELWCSDGTPEGTRLVADVFDGESSSYPSELTAVGTDVFFQAFHPSSGAELWKSDGTDDGTEIVADILPGTGSSIPRELTATADGVFFHADDGVHGREIWFSGVAEANAHLVQDLETGAAGSSPEQLTYGEGVLYFVAEGDGGRGLWKRDTSEDSAQLLHRGAGKGAIDSEIRHITPIGSVVYFQATGGGNGPEVWMTDGTQDGTMTLGDIWNGQFGSYPAEFVAMGDHVVFSADDGIHGMELWSSDGTPDGTVILTDLYPGENASEPRFIRKLGETLLCFATDGDSSYQLWRIDDGIMHPIGDVNP